MKVKKILYFIPVALTFLLYWAIAKFLLEKPIKSPVFDYIPSEVTQVIQTNPSKIVKKYAFQRIFREQETLERFPEADQRFEKNISTDPGINFFAPILFMKENWADGDVWLVLIELNNKAKFAEFLQRQKFNENISSQFNEEVAIFSLSFGPDNNEVVKHVKNILNKEFKPFNLNSQKATDLLSYNNDITFFLSNKKFSEESVFELIRGKVNFVKESVVIEGNMEAREVIPYQPSDYLTLNPEGFHLTSLVPPEELLPFVLPENIEVPKLPKAKFFSMNIIGVDVQIMGEKDTLSDEDYIVNPLIDIIILPEDKASFEQFLNSQITDSILVATDKNHTYSYGYKQTLNIRPIQDEYYLISTRPQKEVNAKVKKLEHVAAMEVEIQEIFNNIAVRMPSEEGGTIANSMIEKTIASAIEKQLLGFDNLKRFEFYVDPSDETHLDTHGNFYFNTSESHSIIELLIIVQELDELHLF